MSYIQIIITAFTTFPLIALMITFPYILVQYHKYGSIQNLRVIIVYSFVLYLLTCYFLVILPLPPIDEVALYTTKRMQLIPFHFVKDFIEQTRVIFGNPKTYLYFFKDSCSYQVLYNLFLTLPFGIYLRYYYQCSLRKTILFSFLLSLFFELTQLSGLYFIYPRGYRLFDVDDLIINTLGGMIGYAIAPLVEKILPTREELDRRSLEKGQKVSLLRRFLSFSFDFLLFFIITLLFSFLLQDIVLSYFISTLLYYFIVPCFSKGQTLFQKFFNLRISSCNFNGDIADDKLKKGWFLFRTILFYFIFLPMPFYCLKVASIIINYYHFSSMIVYLVTMIVYFHFLLYTFFIPLLKKKRAFYEKMSYTKIVSTIALKAKEENEVPIE